MAFRTFTEKEAGKLEELASSFRERVMPVIDKINSLCRDEDCSVHIISGYRSSKKQEQLYRKGRKFHNGRWRRTGDPVVTHAKPGHSAHEYRLAVDIALLNDSNRHWIDNVDERWHTIVGNTVVAAKLTWGGNFSNLFDAAHIEDPGWREVAGELGWRGLQ